MSGNGLTPARWQRVKEIVADALDRSAADRATFVANACADDDSLRHEVESLLEHSEEKTNLDAFAADLSWTRAEEKDARVGQLVGDYRILHPIGRGGMGAVYLAERADREFEKNVAIKILKRGTDTDEVLRRFRRERQILAQLAHPNIAHLLDAGTTEDGLPYFAMEYVQGTPITDFCDARNLSVSARLELFLKVCAAVQFAHRNLIVHRDIKPGNIFVTEDGEPKLLDFGIAKLLTPEAADTQLTMQDRQRLTPGYASPEQVRGEPVTTASDVYSLGALLYELLTARTPHRFSSPHPTETEMLRVISEGELPAASSAAQKPDMRRKLRGDLDNILASALRKEPERRYSGVAAFAEDIRRFLEGRTVRAHRDTFGYRTSKFVRRNRLAVAAAALVFLALVVGLGVAAWQAQIAAAQAKVARAERAKAEQRFNQVRELARSVIFDYHDAIAALPGSTAVRERIVQDALKYLDNLSQEASEDRPLLREMASAYEKVGKVQGNSLYSNLGNTDGAMKSYRASLAIREKLLADTPEDRELQHEVADSHEGVGDILYTAGDLTAGVQSYQRALETRERLAAAEPETLRYALALGQLYTKLGDIHGMEGYTNLGDTTGALAHYRKAQAVLEPLAAAHPQDQEVKSSYCTLLTHSSAVAMKSGDALGALDAARRALVLLEQIAAFDPNNQNSRSEMLAGKAVLRLVLAENNLLPEAIELSKSIIADMEKMSAADPENSSFRRSLGVTYNALARDLLSSGNPAGALESHRKALVIAEAAFRSDPNSDDAKADYAFTLQRVGEAHAANGEHPAALEKYREALAIREPMAAAATSNASARDDVAIIHMHIARSVGAAGKSPAAIAAFRKALPLSEESSAQDPANARRRTRLAIAYADFAKLYLTAARAAQRDRAESAEDWRQAREHFARSLDLWNELRGRNVVTPVNVPKVQEVERALSECDAALSR